MAKKTTNATKPQPKKAAAAAAEEISLENVSEDVSGSEEDSEDFSSDEEIDVQGLVEEPSKKASHTVKITKDSSKSETSAAAKKRAVIYVGRLPKSFEERELKKYFAQFGEIIRARVSRNKVTGASRHYAFVEFKDLSAAQVAAETMNNYLLVGHLLKVHVVENPQDNLFSKNMKSDFREFDWRAKEYAQLCAPKPLETWKELQKKYEESKKQTFVDLKKLGFNYVLEA